MQFRVVRLSGWRAILAVLAGLIGLAAIVALLVVGFFLVALPALVVAAIAWRLLPRTRPSVGPVGDAKTIEGVYEVSPDATETRRLEP
jgi:hypothetical protein